MIHIQGDFERFVASPVVGIPRPSNNVLRFGEDRPQWWFVVAIPELLSKDSPLQSATYDAVHDGPTRVVQPDQDVRSAQQ
jgi:hypothetical protein